MRDGVGVRADLLRPSGTGRHPAILIRSYNRARQRENAAGLLEALIQAGYAVINSDIRGRFESEGEWHPDQAHEVEGPDGYDTVKWIGEQPWSDGDVGLWGISHAASFAWATALQHPPQLRAVAPWTGGFGGGRGAVGGGYRPARSGGVMALHTTLVWLTNEAADVVDRAEQKGEDVTGVRRLLQAMRARPEDFYNHLPLLDHPIARFRPIRDLLEWRLQAASVPPASVRPAYEDVTYPTFHECGWYDGLAIAQLEAFAGLRSHAGTAAAREAQHLIVGPWPHASSFGSILGDINFGQEASSRGSRVYELQIAFFDRYVRNRKEVRLPRVRYFVMGKREWREADSWPLPGTMWRRFYLHSRGAANSAGGDGMLSEEEPASEPPDRFIYDPLRPVPTVGGPLVGQLEGPAIIAGPLEQSHVEWRQDVLCYTTAKLPQPVEVTGPLELLLFASTSARDTDFTAKLVDVYPDGQAYNLAEGVLRLSGRNMSGTREWAVAGEVYALEVTLGPTSQYFPAGHRIRLDISSSNFPQYDRNMNTGNPAGTEALGVPALQTVFHEHRQASYIALPFIPVEAQTHALAG